MTKRKHMNRAAATKMNVRVLFLFYPPTHVSPKEIPCLTSRKLINFYDKFSHPKRPCLFALKPTPNRPPLQIRFIDHETKAMERWSGGWRRVHGEKTNMANGGNCNLEERTFSALQLQLQHRFDLAWLRKKNSNRNYFFSHFSSFRLVKIVNFHHRITFHSLCNKKPSKKRPDFISRYYVKPPLKNIIWRFNVTITDSEWHWAARDSVRLCAQ